ncbi:MAG: hypothetical protein NC124_14850 [Clostridium sp.]|nr:hypothetical protein [Clostridium sp.]
MEMCYDEMLVMPGSYAVMDEAEMMYVEGGGIGGAAIGFVGGLGVGLCEGAIKASITGNNSKIWKCAVKRTIKCTVAGALLPY